MRRTIAITRPARLSRDKTRLRIDNADGSHYIPTEDIDLIVVDHEAVELTAPLLGLLGDLGVAAVFCNAKHLPSGYFLPYAGHTLMPQVLRAQIEAGLPAQKRIWRAIVQAKINAQARLLLHVTGDDLGLAARARRVRSGDSTNQEGVAASLYFPALFGDRFKRRRTGIPERLDPEDLIADPTLRAEPALEPWEDGYRIENGMLNYGYAVLRAAVARAVVGAGLQPAIGLFHRHRENTFALADDLMEPLRPLVDAETYRTLESAVDLPSDLTPAIKRRLLGVLTSEVQWRGGLTPLDVALEGYAAGVRECLMGNVDSPDIPVVSPWAE